MTKRILSVLLTLMLVISCASIVSAADENAVYLQSGGTGDGTYDDPCGTLDAAIAALGGKDGTIYVFGTYDIGRFNAPAWEGMVTITGANADSLLIVEQNYGANFQGDVTFKDIAFQPGTSSHVNPLGGKMIFDIGDDNSFDSFLHLSSVGNALVDFGDFTLESGHIDRLDFGGGYNTSLANGVFGDTTLTINGGHADGIRFSADRFMDTHTGISIGGNMNLIINGGRVDGIDTLGVTKPEIMGALNIIFNNGMQAPEKFVYPDTAAFGTFIIYSEEGGMITPTADPGVFNVKADKGNVAVIDGKQVFNGTVTLEAGETDVTWVPGEQPEQEPEEEPIEIKLVIGSAELVKNGEKTTLDVPAQIIDDRTMVPLRAIFEALGASVEWDDATKTVTSVKDDTTVKLTIGENKLTVNGEEKTLDVPGQIVESRTLVPARAVAESFGCTVEWDAPTQTVTITK